MTVFYNLLASWWNDFWSKITVLEPLLLQNTVNTNVLRRFLQQIHPPTATRSVKPMGVYTKDYLSISKSSPPPKTLFGPRYMIAQATENSLHYQGIEEAILSSLEWAAISLSKEYLFFLAQKKTLVFAWLEEKYQKICLK